MKRKVFDAAFRYCLKVWLFALVLGSLLLYLGFVLFDEFSLFEGLGFYGLALIYGASASVINLLLLSLVVFFLMNMKFNERMVLFRILLSFVVLFLTFGLFSSNGGSSMMKLGVGFYFPATYSLAGIIGVWVFPLPARPR